MELTTHPSVYLSVRLPPSFHPLCTEFQSYPNSRPLSWWCHPTISSSVVPFSSCLQSFPTSGSFQMSQLFASGGQCVMSRIILWAEDKTCRGEGSRGGAQIGETVGSGSRWRKRLRGSYTTLQAETRSQPLCATQNETALPLILIWLVNSIKMWGLGGRGWGESFSQLSFFSSFDLDRV